MPLARHRVVGSPTPTKIYVLVLTTQLCAVSPRALSRQAIMEFCVRQGVRFCPRGRALCVRDRTGMVLTTPYRANLRIADCQFLRKVGNSGILCETRREVLRTRERTLVRDRTGMVLTTQYHAKLRTADCQFLRKVGNSGILCETRREVLPARERTSVRDQVLRFSQRRIVRNYALPT